MRVGAWLTVNNASQTVAVRLALCQAGRVAQAPGVEPDQPQGHGQPSSVGRLKDLGAELLGIPKPAASSSRAPLIVTAPWGFAEIVSNSVDNCVHCRVAQTRS